jgi:hypothetical protein
MIVYDLNIARTNRAVSPTKADAPLVVDSNAPLAFAVPFQLFQPMAGEVCDIRQPRRQIEPVQYTLSPTPERFEWLDPFTLRKTPCPCVCVAQDHAGWSTNRYALRQA